MALWRNGEFHKTRLPHYPIGIRIQTLVLRTGQPAAVAELPPHDCTIPWLGFLHDDTGVGSLAGVLDLIANDLEIPKQIE